MCLTTVALIKVRFVSVRNEMLDRFLLFQRPSPLFELRNLEMFFSH